jgi:hypothetical protein
MWRLRVWLLSLSLRFQMLDGIRLVKDYCCPVAVCCRVVAAAGLKVL